MKQGDTSKTLLWFYIVMFFEVFIDSYVQKFDTIAVVLY